MQRLRFVQDPFELGIAANRIEPRIGSHLRVTEVASIDGALQHVVGATGVAEIGELPRRDNNAPSGSWKPLRISSSLACKARFPISFQQRAQRTHEHPAASLLRYDKFLLLQHRDRLLHSPEHREPHAA